MPSSKSYSLKKQLKKIDKKIFEFLLLLFFVKHQLQSITLNIFRVLVQYAISCTSGGLVYYLCCIYLFGEYLYFITLQLKLIKIMGHRFLVYVADDILERYDFSN